MIKETFTGLTSHLHAIRLLAQVPHIRRLAVIPFLINSVLFVVGVPLVVWWAIGFVDSLIGDGVWWLDALTVVAQVVATLVVTIAALFLFTLIGTIIAGPFNGPLSEAVERYERERRGIAMEAIAQRGIVRDAGRAILYEIGRLFTFLLVYPLIFATQFIPLVGTVVQPVLAFLYTAFVLSVDFSDPTLDRYIDIVSRQARLCLEAKSYLSRLRFQYSRDDAHSVP